MALKERDEFSGQLTTGHEWNGIKELNTPVPRAVWFFLIVTALFSLGYWVLMPAWPLGKSYTKGLLGMDDRAQVSQRVDAAVADRAGMIERITALGYDQVRADPALMTFVREDGHRLFGDNCAACHGINAAGNKGYPNLTDGDWLWGGSPDAIAHTLEVGINSPASNQTRIGQMLAFGRDGILDNASVLAVVDYVKSLSDPAWAKGRAASISKGREVFAANCTVCHGEDGRGSQAVGAPNLTDNVWLFGGEIDDIYQTVQDGRRGEMPAWGQRLSAADRKILVLFLLDKGSHR